MSAILKDQGMQFRPIRITDLPEILAIERSAYEFPWTEGIFRDCLRIGYCCWLIEQNQRIQAYGIMSVGAGESHILNICVRPDERRRGLGRKLLDYLITLARRHNADTALLEVRPSNRAALGLYKSLGFNEVGMRKAYYPDKQGREDALILALAL